MKTYTRQDIDAAFDAVGLGRGDLVMVHSALYAFGLPEDMTVKEIDGAMYQALRQRIGPEGTIVVPTFNFDFCEGVPFDAKRTPSKNMGNFAEYVRLLPDSVRSPHPLQSLSINGPQAAYICKNDTLSAYDLDGSFDHLIKAHAKILLLGATTGEVSHAHYVEERVGVPYRYWKDFSGKYTNAAGEHSTRTYKMYVRDMKLNPQRKPPKKDFLIEERKVKSAPLGVGAIQYFNVQDFVDFTEQRVRQDPYHLIQ